MTKYHIFLLIFTTFIVLFYLFPVPMLCLSLPLVFFATFQRYPYHSHYWW